MGLGSLTLTCLCVGGGTFRLPLGRKEEKKKKEIWKKSLLVWLPASNHGMVGAVGDDRKLPTFHHSKRSLSIQLSPDSLFPIPLIPHGLTFSQLLPAPCLQCLHSALHTFTFSLHSACRLLPSHLSFATAFSILFILSMPTFPILIPFYLSVVPAFIPFVAFCHALPIRFALYHHSLPTSS